MALFLATHINRLDKKGRVCTPSLWRAALTTPEFSGIVLIPSARATCLDGFDMGRMQQLSNALDEFDFYSEEQIAGATTMFGEAQPLTFDAEGRVTLPAELIAHANLGENVAFVGLGQFFQVWDAQAFKMHQATQRDFMKKHRLSMKLGG